MDRYAVLGNPVSHSLSPAIQARFAAQCGEAIEYAAREIPLDAFATHARAFFDAGASGANVTLPFKTDAFEFADRRSPRAELAGAVNTLIARADGIEGDNTDGVGLVNDLTRNLDIELRGRRVLLVGSGGAARGVVAPLLAQSPRELVIANRTLERARELAERFGSLGPIAASGLDPIAGGPFDVVINATSTSTHGQALELPAGVLAAGALAYDMAYGPAALAFLAKAREQGARIADGLGMLVEQAAESFWLWRGKRPDTAPVLAELRGQR